MDITANFWTSKGAVFHPLEIDFFRCSEKTEYAAKTVLCLVVMALLVRTFMCSYHIAYCPFDQNQVAEGGVTSVTLGLQLMELQRYPVGKGGIFEYTIVNKFAWINVLGRTLSAEDDWTVS